MRGYNTLWQPGIDHAGIATQIVVERQLKREGKTRHDLGREEFIERVWEWKAESGGAHRAAAARARRSRRLGAHRSSRWTRTCRAPSREAFVRLYEEGLIYRATRLINWCLECRRRRSRDLEVENEEGANGELFEFAYQVDGDDGEIVVATTRPETMLGDTAVAVHPDDPRYKHLHGKMLVHPFVDRKIPIITDAILVDPKFGTGAVKVTPAHDFNDFATGKRHKLEEINIFNLDGTVNENGGRVRRARSQARAQGGEEARSTRRASRAGAKPHMLTLPEVPALGHRRRADDLDAVVREDEAAGRAGARRPCASGETQIIPEEWTKTYDHFMREHPGLVHLAPALVGPSNPRVVLRRTAHDHASRATTPGCGVRPSRAGRRTATCSTPGSRAGSGRSRRWAGPNETPTLAEVLSRERSRDGLRHPLLLGRPHDDVRAPLHGGGAVPARAPARDGRRRDRRQDEQGEGQRHRPARPHLRRDASTRWSTEDPAGRARRRRRWRSSRRRIPSAAQMGTGFPAFGADAAALHARDATRRSNKRIALAPKRIEGYRHFCNKIWNATRFALELPRGATRRLDGGAAGGDALANRWILVAARGSDRDRARRASTTFRIDEAANGALPLLLERLLRLVPRAHRSRSSRDERRRRWRARRATCSRTCSRRRSARSIRHAVRHRGALAARAAPGVAPSVASRSAPLPDARDGRRDETADREMAIVQAVIRRRPHDPQRARGASGREVPLALRADDERARELLKRRELVAISHAREDAGRSGRLRTGGGGRPPRRSVIERRGRRRGAGRLKGLVDAGQRERPRSSAR